MKIQSRSSWYSKFVTLKRIFDIPGWISVGCLSEWFLKMKCTTRRKYLKSSNSDVAHLYSQLEEYDVQSRESWSETSNADQQNNGTKLLHLSLAHNILMKPVNQNWLLLVVLEMTRKQRSKLQALEMNFVGCGIQHGTS